MKLGIKLTPLTDSIALFESTVFEIIPQKRIDPNDPNQSIATYNLSEIVSRFQFPRSVCSTINPYSQQNIIGSFSEQHDTINKIYPYDRQNMFQLWFNDAEGNRIINNNITGYIDLELIVDSSNNLNLEI